MIEGKVKWFNTKKGFGFIASPDGPDVFVHFSAVEDYKSDKLQEGDVVEYEAVRGEKGPKAAKVIKKGAASSS